MVPLNQAWKRSVILLGAIFAVFLCTLFLFPSSVPDDLQSKIPFSSNKNEHEKETLPEPEMPALSNAFHSDLPQDYTPNLSHFPSIIRALWQPLILNQTTRSFVDREGKKHTLPVEPIYTEKLGKKLVILDVDTRPLNDTGEVNAVETPTWENLHHLSAGIFSHYLYALIHGYDYKFIRSPDFEDQQGGWTKVIMSHEMMKTHDWVVTIDSDAEFTNPEVPLEWLMNKWNITSETAIAIANDPAGDPNFDSKGKVMLNTGFFFSQKAAPKVEEIYKAWGACTTEEQFPGCAEWKYGSFREQTAFSEHVRYAFEDEGVIKALPCTEANGYPEVADSGCTGQFVKHFWMHKKLSKRQLADGVMQAVLPQLATLFQDQVLDLSSKHIKQNEIYS